MGGGGEGQRVHGGADVDATVPLSTIMWDVGSRQ